MSDKQKQFETVDKIVHYRKVSNNSAINWLTQAWTLFRQNPLIWFSSLILMFFLLILIMLLPIVNFLSIVLTPIFTAGLMVGCNQLKNNQAFNQGHLFAGFKQHLNPLIIVGFIYLGYTLACSFIAVELSTLAGKPLMHVTPEMLTSGTLDVRAFLESLLLPLLILMALMLPMFMATWFAPALVILRNVKAIDALRQSFLACLVNIKPFSLFGLFAFVGVLLVTILVSLLVTLIPALSVILKLLSNLFFMSIVFASMFTSFEDIFFQEETSQEDNAAINPEANNNDDGPTSIIL